MPAAAAEPDFAGLRAPVTRCAACQRSMPPYVYFENGKDYCVPCAHSVQRMGMRIAGRRADDIKELPPAD
jgi:recombinational DNA repair protein (RecF pathway)